MNKLISLITNKGISNLSMTITIAASGYMFGMTMVNIYKKVNKKYNLNSRVIDFFNINYKSKGGDTNIVSSIPFPRSNDMNESNESNESNDSNESNEGDNTESVDQSNRFRMNNRNMNNRFNRNDKNDEQKIREIDKSPLELKKRFALKGYTFILRNLATVNTELNEFVELMRKMDLHILDGCKNPDTCQCNFRYKNCRTFMIRKTSSNNDYQIFAPSCSGVTYISPSNSDIQNNTPIHEFVQLFHNTFYERVLDVVNYINYITSQNNFSKNTHNANRNYVVDITLVADPFDCSEDRYKDHNNNSNGEIVVDTKINTNTNYVSKWNQDRFSDAKTNKQHAYDYVATFVLGSKDITSHKMMIGKIENDTDSNVTNIAELWIDDTHNADIGYVLDQTQGFLHKHTEFSYLSPYGHRNVITIKYKFL